MSRLLKISPRVLPPRAAVSSPTGGEEKELLTSLQRLSLKEKPAFVAPRKSSHKVLKSPKTVSPRSPPKSMSPRSPPPPRRRENSPKRKTPAEEDKEEKKLLKAGELQLRELLYYRAIAQNDFPFLTLALAKKTTYSWLLVALKVYLEHHLLTLPQMRFFTTLAEEKYGADADLLRTWVASWKYLYPYWKAGQTDPAADEVFTYLINEVWNNVAPEEIYEEVDALVESLPQKIAEKDIPFFEDIYHIFWFESGEGDTEVSDVILQAVKKRVISQRVYREIAKAFHR